MATYIITAKHDNKTFTFTLVNEGRKFRCYIEESSYPLYSVLTKKAWVEKIAKFYSIVKIEKA